MNKYAIIEKVKVKLALSDHIDNYLEKYIKERLTKSQLKEIDTFIVREANKHINYYYNSQIFSDKGICAYVYDKLKEHYSGKKSLSSRLIVKIMLQILTEVFLNPYSDLLQKIKKETEDIERSIDVKTLSQAEGTKELKGKVRDLFKEELNKVLKKLN